MSMKTDELIAVLSQSETLPKKPLSSYMVMAGLVIIWALATIALFGGRTDWYELTNAFYIKTALLLGSVLCGAYYARKSANTLGNDSLYIGFWVVAAGLATWLGYEWTHYSADYILPALTSDAAMHCMRSTVLYGLLSMATLTMIFKQYAPGNVTQSAHNIGLTSGLIAGFGYSIHCMMDSPTYILFAYGLPVLGIWVLSRLILPRFLNW